MVTLILFDIQGERVFQMQTATPTQSVSVGKVEVNCVSTPNHFLDNYLLVSMAHVSLMN